MQTEGRSGTMSLRRNRAKNISLHSRKRAVRCDVRRSVSRAAGTTSAAHGREVARNARRFGWCQAPASGWGAANGSDDGHSRGHGASKQPPDSRFRVAPRWLGGLSRCRSTCDDQENVFSAPRQFERMAMAWAKECEQDRLRNRRIGRIGR